jgi:hypothetical protein
MAELHSAYVDVRAGERVEFSGPASIELVHKSGQLARLRVFATLDVVVSKKSIEHADLRTKHGVVESG